jgi:hypothetical protein
MQLGKVILALEAEEIIRLMRAALDEDREEALALVRDVLYPRLLKEMEKTHCMPAFELEARKKDGARDEKTWLGKKSVRSGEDSE